MNKEYSTNYMLKLIKAFRDNGSSDYMCIKHYNTLSLPKEEISNAISETEKCYMLYYKYCKHQMLESYQPFLGWIKELYNEFFTDETPEVFVKKAKVYPMQQYSVIEYLRTGKADRIEDILMSELKYERKRFLDSIISMYKYICTRTNIYMVIESLHLASLSGIDAVNRLINNNFHGNLRIVATLNESYQTLPYREAAWNELLRCIERQSYQYEWGMIDNSVILDTQDVFIPVEDRMEEYLNIARNMYFFVCPQDAKYYMEIILDKIENNKFTITTEQYARFLQLFVLIEVECGEYSKALQLCEYFGVIARDSEDDTLLYNYYYLCAMTQFGMEQLTNKITVYVDKCKAIARKNGDELAAYKPQVLQLLSDCNYWRDIYIDYYGKYVSGELLEMTERFGFKNILAYIYIYCFSIKEEVLYSVSRHKEELLYFNNGVKLAREIENYELVISAYTKNIVVFSNAGYHDYVSELFEKKMEAVNIEKNIARMVHTYNGMGYNASATEKYQKAEEYFCESINKLLELRNGEEIAVTLYNSALNKLLAREYTYAADEFLLLIKVMDTLELHSITISDTARFYGMLGFCSFYIGEDYRCCYCIDKMDMYLKHLDHVEDPSKYCYWYSTLFLRNLLSAMMDVADSKFESAKEKFDYAKTIMEADAEKKYFTYLLYVQELAKYYDAIGDENGRKNVLREGIAYCDQNGYSLRSAILMAELNKRHEVGRKGLQLKRSVSDEKILEVVESIALEQKLENRKKDLDFLTIWQELLGKCRKSTEVMPQTFNIMKNYFDFDGIFMVGSREGQAVIEYMDCPALNEKEDNVTRRVYNFSNDDLNKILDYFRENKKTILINRVEKEFYEYKEILKVIGLYQVVSLFVSPLFGGDGNLNGVIIGYVEMRKYAMLHRYLLNGNNLVVLKLACEQLYNTIERLNYIEVIQQMNAQLKDMAITDLLTGMYNRQGLDKIVMECKSKDCNKILVYVDLDNFKYYNDTFGHELGDRVLVRFSKMLKNIVENIGYAIRYGGDEFVLILEKMELTKLREVVEKIFADMQKQLIPELKNELGDNVIIPEDKLLTCSIGISEWKGDVSFSEALNRADEALYEVKRNSKNGYSIWKCK